MKLITALFSLLLVSAAPLVAQIQGNQDWVNMPGNQDKSSRIAGFAYNSHYYIAYNNNSNGLSGGIAPALYYGKVTGSGATPPVLNFANPKTMYIPGVAKDTNLCHMAASVNGSPYIFQFKCSRSGAPAIQSASFEKLISPIVPNGPPTFTTIGTFSSSVTSQIGNLFDVAAASLHGKTYLFCLRSTNTKADSIWVLSYGGQGTPAPDFDQVSVNGVDDTVQSLDATNVTLASGEQAIVLTATFVASGHAQVKTWLFDGTSNNLTPYSLAEPPYAQFPAAVRIAYGPAQGTSPINSCTLFYAAVDNGFFGVSSKIFTTQLALPATLQGSVSQPNNWAEINGIWQNRRNGQYNQYPYAWTAFPVSVPTKTKTNNYANVFQYINLVECGLSVNPNPANDSFVSTPSLHMKVDPNNAGVEWNSGNLEGRSDADIKAAVQSWNLLGVITGLPPLPAGSPVTYTRPILALNYNSTNTGSKLNTQTNGVTAGVGVDIPELTASDTYTYSIRQSAGTSNSLSLNLGLSYNTDSSGTYDASADIGFLIVSQPILFTAKYDVYAYDSTTYLGMSTVSVSTQGTSLASIPFYLNDPTTPVDGYPACIYESFPVDNASAPLVTYPETTDITGWMNPDDLTQTQPLFKSLGQQYLNCNTFTAVQLGLSSTQLNSYSGDTSNTLDAGIDVSFLGVQAKVDSKIKLQSSTSTVFSTSQSSQLMYPILQPSKGYSAIRLHVMFDRLVDAPTDAPNWMPAIFTGSKPWVLHWKVDSATPTNPAP